MGEGGEGKGGRKSDLGADGSRDGRITGRSCEVRKCQELRGKMWELLTGKCSCDPDMENRKTPLEV